MKNKFEIGITYKKNNIYSIAVSEESLVTYQDGNFSDFEEKDEQKACRSLSVEDLCKIWNISTDKLDELTPRYFTPNYCSKKNPSNKRGRPTDGSGLRLAKLYH